MSTRKQPTSVLLHKRNDLAADLFRACADGRLKDVKKIKSKFIQSCIDYKKRLHDEEQEQLAKEAKKLKKDTKHEQKQRK